MVLVSRRSGGNASRNATFLNSPLLQIHTFLYDFTLLLKSNVCDVSRSDVCVPARDFVHFSLLPRSQSPSQKTHSELNVCAHSSRPNQPVCLSPSLSHPAQINPWWAACLALTVRTLGWLPSLVVWLSWFPCFLLVPSLPSVGRKNGNTLSQSLCPPTHFLSLALCLPLIWVPLIFSRFNCP